MKTDFSPDIVRQRLISLFPAEFIDDLAREVEVEGVGVLEYDVRIP